jgi:hypothetical protein
MIEAKRDLETVLADAREDAQRLRAHGHSTHATSIERLADDVATTMRGYLTVLTESEAMLRSGWTVARLKAKFAEWEAVGFAVLDGRGKRRYRETIVPVREERAASRLAGIRGESLKKASGR